MKKPENGKKSEYQQTSFVGMLVTGFLLCLMMTVLYFVQDSVPYTVRKESIELIDQKEIRKAKSETRILDIPDYLIITEKEDATSEDVCEELEPMLSQMKVAYDVCDTSEFSIDQLRKYHHVLLAVTHYQLMSDYLGDLKEWVKKGGNLMVLYPPEVNGSFSSMFDLFGIKECGNLAVVEEVQFADGFLLGADDRKFAVTDPYDCAIALTLSPEDEVYMETTDTYSVPLIYRRDCGQGSVVFDNFGVWEKAYRGLHASALSLLGDSFVYPVINASTFYIDDFPAPVPEGDGIYIKRDYNMDIDNFYTQVWWHDIYDLAQKYGVRYTGLVIENYSAQVKGTFARNDDTERYSYFGNMLLQDGGEIGIHGYNHMPLVLKNFDYQDQYDSYHQWPTTDDMSAAVSEVLSFTHQLFEEEELRVYVPPSNILSKEGRAVLAQNGIEAIASVYFPGNLAYDTEFEVSEEDGIVNTPRVVSGYVFDDYMKLAALSELNFHYVSSHFQHPDDALDVDRGAELGWAEMENRLGQYMNWLYTSCPNIRNLTGSELAAVVERYDVLEVKRSKFKGKLELSFENFYGEANMLLRLNKNQKIVNVVGGTYEEMGKQLYLLSCDQDKVEVWLTEGE